MTDLMQLLSTLRRPRLLIRAARFGIADYNRERDLKRLIREPSAPTPARALTRLISEEAVLEETRTNGDASYSVARHVDILIALMAEARLLPTGPRAV
ncbi:MAG: DUF6477 family protein [Paracoccaceae bacterium]